MTQNKQISVYVNEKEEELTKEASVIVGLNLASFFRSCTVKEARRIIRQNKEVLRDDRGE